MTIDEVRKFISQTIEEAASDWETEGWWGEMGTPTSPNYIAKLLHARLDTKLNALSRVEREL